VSWTTHRARIAGFRSQGRQADDPEVVAEHLKLKVARFKEQSKDFVNSAPAPSVEDCASIAAILLAPTLASTVDGEAA
jgi:hypothetical protein